MVAPRAHHLFRARYLGPGTRGFLFASARGGLACPVLLQNAECMRGLPVGAPVSSLPRQETQPWRGFFMRWPPTFGIGCRRADWSRPGPAVPQLKLRLWAGLFHGLLACPMWLLSVTESYKLNLFSFDGAGQSSIRCCGGARSREASRWASGLVWQS
jgi:hypothetical protein